MDEELKQRVLSYMDATERVVSSEMPLVAQEYLNWDWMVSISTCGLFAVFSLILVAIERALLKSPADQDSKVVGNFLVGLALVASVIITAASAQRAAKVVIAPRVVLLEKAADLIGGGK
jgi:hypothetical protein